MKIDITYEKADILRLVTEDLQKKGIKAKAGAPIEYKGALSVKLSVDSDEEVEALPSETVSTSASAVIKNPPSPEPSMDDILRASNRAAQTPPTFGGKEPPERVLADNESYEFPEE